MFGWLKEKLTGKRPEFSRSEVLAAIPLRNPRVEWERLTPDPEDPESVPVIRMKIPRRADRMGNLAAKIFRLPDFRKMELDEIGSGVWDMCDGTRTVEDITKALVSGYRLNRRQAEASVTAYLKMLAERRLIALKTGKPAPAARETRESSGRQSGRTRGQNAPRKQKRA